MDQVAGVIDPTGVAFRAQRRGLGTIGIFFAEKNQANGPVLVPRGHLRSKAFWEPAPADRQSKRVVGEGILNIELLVVQFLPHLVAELTSRDRSEFSDKSSNTGHQSSELAERGERPGRFTTRTANRVRTLRM